MAIKCTISKGSGWARCPDDWHKRDPGLEAATTGTLAGGLVRLIAEYREKQRYFSRSRSLASLKSNVLGLGWASTAHPQTKKPRQIIAKFTRLHPALAAKAWPGVNLSSDAAIKEVLDDFIGFKGTKLSSSQRRFIEGWNKASKTAQFQRIYTEKLFDLVVKPALKAMKERGWTDVRTLAALARLKNSSGTWMNRLARHDSDSERIARKAVLDRYYKSHDNDVEAIRGWGIFDGKLEREPSYEDLNYDVYPTELGGADRPTPYQKPPPSRETAVVSREALEREPGTSKGGGGGGMALIGVALLLGAGYLAYREFKK